MGTNSNSVCLLIISSQLISTSKNRTSRTYYTLVSDWLLSSCTVLNIDQYVGYASRPWTFFIYRWSDLYTSQIISEVDVFDIKRRYDLRAFDSLPISSWHCGPKWCQDCMTAFNKRRADNSGIRDGKGNFDVANCSSSSSSSSGDI